jgi:hypothetical protein
MLLNHRTENDKKFNVQSTRNDIRNFNLNEKVCHAGLQNPRKLKLKVIRHFATKLLRSTKAMIKSPLETD